MEPLIDQIELSILFLICGSILFFVTLVVFIIFIGYKELRQGIYSILITTTLCEIYIGLHSIINAINGFTNKSSTDFFCYLDAFLTVFFLGYWLLHNFSIMFLYFTRQLDSNRLIKYLHIINLILASLLSISLHLTDSTGISFCNTCFLNKSSNISVALAIGLVYTFFLVSILYNLWFFCFRDSSKDRNIINGFNYFVLITSINWCFLVTNISMIGFFNTISNTFNYIVVVVMNLSFLYISYFRWKIEYVQIVLKNGPSYYNIINAFLFLICIFRRPKFKDIKKVVNVKVLNVTDLDNTILSHIRKTSEAFFKY